MISVSNSLQMIVYAKTLLSRRYIIQTNYLCPKMIWHSIGLADLSKVHENIHIIYMAYLRETSTILMISGKSLHASILFSVFETR